MKQLEVIENLIAKENSTAISNALGSPTFKIEETGSSDADTEYFKSRYTKLSDVITDGKKLVEDIEAEGAVLLKNENDALPLAKGNKVSLFGIASYAPAYGGKGSAQSGTTEGAISLKQGLENAGFEVNADLFNLSMKSTFFAVRISL